MYKETLYGLDKKGGFKVWEIETNDSEDGLTSNIVVRHGKLDGAMTEQVTAVAKGKQGRTVSEQAVNEAKGKVKEKLDKNYRRTQAELTELPLLPMLASDNREQGHRIDYEAGVDLSDKLDGVRLLAKCVYDQERQHSVVQLFSRTGQPYVIPHIEQELTSFMEPGDVLDGEAYLHGEALQDITSAVKRTDPQAKIDEIHRAIEKNGADYRKPSKEEGVVNPTLAEELENADLIQRIRPQLQFIVFDLPSDKVWHERLEDLTTYAKKRFLGEDAFVKLIKYTRVFNEEAMKYWHKDAVSRGYEGIMLRNMLGLYESGKRSADLQKYKEFLDSEFLVIGYTFDKDGHIVFVCRNDLNDFPFSVIFGTDEEKTAMLAVAGKFMHKYLKVKYQSRYKKTLLPQFPTGIMFRDGKLVNGEFVPDE
ncbi:hypothetical protein [Pseudomonas sp. P8_250]|uniref:ATP-dependent DNA ligase n=1 Tax=Pseudomonas sp. P8_250 TaxID=3043446 RepID=UPI002A3683D4|nr:hypothetical protein [Pseudomonas sp. P8_250]MDX9668673.1 hypothetical protein [Pseudomonas sp. P8_250]